MSEAAREARAAKLAFALLVGLTGLRLLLVSFVGLGDAEAYYWTWSRHLALSYFDHPPLVAYMIAATTALGSSASFFVRLGPVLLCAATAWLVFLLASSLSGSKRCGLGALVLFQITPVFALGGQGANPDVLLGFFWTLALLSIWKVTRDGRGGFVWLAGLSLGLALLSKYFAVVLGLTLFVWLLRSENRSWLKKPSVWGAVLVALVFAVPIAIWNVEHDWPSLRYHFGRHGAAGFSWKQAGVFLGGQALYYSPFLWGGFIAALVACVRQARAAKADDRSQRAYAFLATAAIPAVAIFTLIGIWTPEAEPHWTAMGYVPLCIGAAMRFPVWWERPPSGRRTAFRIFARVAVGLPILLLVAVHLHLLTSWFVPLVPQRDRPRDLMSETRGWPEVARRIEGIAAKMRDPLLIHYHYTKCSQLSYAVRGRWPVACLNDRMDQFDFWQHEERLVGRDAIYATDSVYGRTPESLWRFDRCRPEPPLDISRGGHHLRRFSFWRCYGYRGPAPGRKNL